jgi:phage shock protein PspC (stress-responsive transcriptional regulator)
VIAGVCGGLGRYFDIDPVIFRILFAVSTFFGGFGLLAYAAGWLLMPAQGRGGSGAGRLLSGNSPARAVGVVVLIVLGFPIMVDTLSSNYGRAAPLLLLATVTVTLLLWLGEGRRRQPAGRAQPDVAQWQFGGLGQPLPWWRRPVPTSPAPGAAGPGSEPEDARDEPPEGGQATAAPDTAEPGAVGEPRVRRTGGLIFSAVMLAIGILWALADAGAVHIGWTAGLALAVMAVGAGMAIGGIFGRTRALVPLGLVLAAPLIMASALGVPLHGASGSATDWAPSSSAALQSPYTLSAGLGELDLSAIDPFGATDSVTSHVGAGKLLVTVPRDVRVHVIAHVGIGRIMFVGETAFYGVNATRSLDLPALGTPRGTIALDLKVGAGDLEVKRAAG